MLFRNFVKGFGRIAAVNAAEMDRTIIRFQEGDRELRVTSQTFDVAANEWTIRLRSTTVAPDKGDQ